MNIWIRFFHSNMKDENLRKKFRNQNRICSFCVTKTYSTQYFIQQCTSDNMLEKLVNLYCTHFGWKFMHYCSMICVILWLVFCLVLTGRCLCNLWWSRTWRSTRELWCLSMSKNSFLLHGPSITTMDMHFLQGTSNALS